VPWEAPLIFSRKRQDFSLGSAKIPKENFVRRLAWAFELKTLFSACARQKQVCGKGG
jgi:hypothetical protein